MYLFAKVKPGIFTNCIEYDKYRKITVKMLISAHKLLRHQQRFHYFPAINIAQN